MPGQKDGDQSVKNVPMAVLPLSVRKLDGSAYAVSEDGSTAEYMALPRIAEDGSCFAVDPSLDGRAFIIRGQERLLPGEPVAVIEGSI